MIGDAAFAAMKPSAVIINIGRGPIIDQAAMVRALFSKEKSKGSRPPASSSRSQSRPAIPSSSSPTSSSHPTAPTKTLKTGSSNAMQFFLQQYDRFSNNQPLENIVEKHLGY